MGQHLVIRRFLIHRYARQQRRLEPATVLVGALEVQIGRPLQTRRLVQHRFMGHARIEPNIQGISDFAIFVSFITKQLFCVQIEPRLDATFFDTLGNFFHQLKSARVQFVIVTTDKHRNRVPPSTLTRDTPVRASLDHAFDAALAPVWNPTHLLNLLERFRPQTLLVHADKPLWRRTENNRSFMAPAMRVRVIVGLVVNQTPSVF